MRIRCSIPSHYSRFVLFLALLIQPGQRCCRHKFVMGCFSFGCFSWLFVMYWACCHDLWFLQQKRPLNAIPCLLMVVVVMSTLGIIFFFCWLYLFGACTCCSFTWSFPSLDDFSFFFGRSLPIQFPRRIASFMVCSAALAGRSSFEARGYAPHQVYVWVPLSWSDTLVPSVDFSLKNRLLLCVCLRCLVFFCLGGHLCSRCYPSLPSKVFPCTTPTVLGRQ